MVGVWLKCLCVFGLIHQFAANGVFRVGRQDYSSNDKVQAAPYQQPFENRNGVYRVQRQDFTHTNDVPFSDSYANSYVNQFSKLNNGYGNVDRSNVAPFPKLFSPANVPKAGNPYLTIGLPNYDRVVPASNFGNVQIKTPAPNRVTRRPETATDEKQHEDGVLPALSHSVRYDIPLPPISEFSKSSPFEEDFSSVVEQFDMTEDRKNLCTGDNCRKSNPSDDADAVKPIRRRRDIEFYPYHRHQMYDHHPSFFPRHRKINFHHPLWRSRSPFENSYNDLMMLRNMQADLRNRLATTEESKAADIEAFSETSTGSVLDLENTFVDGVEATISNEFEKDDVSFVSTTNSMPNYENTSPDEVEVFTSSDESSTSDAEISTEAVSTTSTIPDYENTSPDEVEVFTSSDESSTSGAEISTEAVSTTSTIPDYENTSPDEVEVFTSSDESSTSDAEISTEAASTTSTIPDYETTSPDEIETSTADESTKDDTETTTEEEIPYLVLNGIDDFITGINAIDESEASTTDESLKEDTEITTEEEILCNSTPDLTQDGGNDSSNDINVNSSPSPSVEENTDSYSIFFDSILNGSETEFSSNDETYEKILKMFFTAPKQNVDVKFVLDISEVEIKKRDSQSTDDVESATEMNVADGNIDNKIMPIVRNFEIKDSSDEIYDLSETESISPAADNVEQNTPKATTKSETAEEQTESNFMAEIQPKQFNPAIRKHGIHHFIFKMLPSMSNDDSSSSPDDYENHFNSEDVNFLHDLTKYLASEETIAENHEVDTLKENDVETRESQDKNTSNENYELLSKILDLMDKKVQKLIDDENSLPATETPSVMLLNNV